MRTAPLALLSTAVVAPLVGAAILLPASADAAPPPPIAVEMLTPLRGTFTDDVSVKFKIKRPHHGTQVVSLDDASRVAVARITVQPDAAFPLHTHPGPVVVTVVDGELTYVEADTCDKRVYPAGTAFIDTGGDAHTAYASSPSETTLVATFFGAPEKGPVTVGQTEQTTTCP